MGPWPTADVGWARSRSSTSRASRRRSWRCSDAAIRTDAPLREPPAAHAHGDDAEHDAVGGHGAAAPQPSEAGILGMEALDERAALGAVAEELRPALDDHPADVAAVGPSRLGDHADAWIAAEIAHLLGVLDAEHGHARRVVQEPHRHRQWRPVGLHRREHDDVSDAEEPLDAVAVEAAHFAARRRYSAIAFFKSSYSSHGIRQIFSSALRCRSALARSFAMR